MYVYFQIQTYFLLVINSFKGIFIVMDYPGGDFHPIQKNYQFL